MLFLRLKHSTVFTSFDHSILTQFVKRLRVEVYEKGDIVNKEGKKCAQVLMVMDGRLESTSVKYPLKTQTKVKPLPDQDANCVVYQYGDSLGSECLQSSYSYLMSVIARDPTYCLSLSKKDYAEVIYLHRVQERKQF